MMLTDEVMDVTEPTFERVALDGHPIGLRNR